MDYASYTEKTFEKFVRINVCQSDKVLERYLSQGKVKEFRARLSTIEDADKRIEKVIISLFTEVLRNMIMSKISFLTKKMKSLGFLIVSGGVAINKYLPKNERDIITDIDTKFVPSVKGVPANSPRYFGYIQLAKILMWYYLGAIAMSMTNSLKFKKSVNLIKNTKIAKFLGITWKDLLVTRRYSLIPKFKKSAGSNVSGGDVLIDVEIMALDIQGVRYYSPKAKRITPSTIGGILDIAYMRKGEIGGKVLKSTTKGLGWHKDVLVTGRNFLIEDMYLLKSLHLRPDKVHKDRERLEKFAKYVYKINVTNKNTNFSIYKRAMDKKFNEEYKLTRSYFSKEMIDKIDTLNPRKFMKYTTYPTTGLIKRLKGPRKTTRSAPYKFNVNTKKWIKVRNLAYIKNENGSKLYGYVPRRDSWLPYSIINKASIIPFVGYKDKGRS